MEIKWQLRRQRETAQGDWGFVRRMEQAAAWMDQSEEPSVRKGGGCLK